MDSLAEGQQSFGYAEPFPHRDSPVHKETNFTTPKLRGTGGDRDGERPLAWRIAPALRRGGRTKPWARGTGRRTGRGIGPCQAAEAVSRAAACRADRLAR